MILKKNTYTIRYDANGKAIQPFVGNINKDNAYVDEVVAIIPKSLLSNATTISSVTAKLYVKSQNDMDGVTYSYPKDTNASFSVYSEDETMVECSFVLGERATSFNGKVDATITLFEDTGEDYTDDNDNEFDIIAKKSLDSFYYIVKSSQHKDTAISDEEEESYDTIMAYVGAFDARITINTTTNSSQQTDILALQEEVLDNYLNIQGHRTQIASTNALLESTIARVSDNEDDIATAQSDITTLQSRMTTCEGNYTTLAQSITGTINTAISTHNTSTNSHTDIRALITALSSSLTSFKSQVESLLDSDDTTLDSLQEVVDYIKNNAELIQSITTSKVSVADIVDGLTNTATNKPLSANQGFVLKGLIDVLTETVSSNTSNRHTHLNKTILDGTTASFTDASYVHTDNNFTNELKANINSNTSSINEWDTLLQDIADSCEGI